MFPRLTAIWRAERLWMLPAALLFLWLTALAFIVPLDYDEAVYMTVARGLHHGEWPYRDLWDNKPPLNYLWYQPGAVAGSYQVQRIFGAALCAVSLCFFARIAAYWLNEKDVSFAVWSYAMLLANPFVSAGVGVETFLLVPMLAAVATPSAFLAGALLGIAVMTKPTALFLSPVLMLVWRRDSWQSALGGALACCLILLPFSPVWSELWTANVTFNSDFTAFGASEYGLGKRLGQLFGIAPEAFLGSLPVWIAAVVGAFRIQRTFVVIWCGCAIVAIKANGYTTGTEYPHYHMLLIPPLALLAAPGLRYMVSRTGSRVFIGVTASASALLIAAGVTSAVVGDDPDAAVVDAIHESPGEFYMLGGHPQLYVLADRYPERRWFFEIPLVVDEDWGAEMRQSLRDCPPDILVVEQPGPDDNDPFQVDWADEMAALYAQRQAFDDFDALTEPLRPCVP